MKINPATSFETTKYEANPGVDQQLTTIAMMIR